jgi:hypothetical protein
VKNYLFVALLFIAFSSSAQLTETFRSIDEKHSFKDIPFGSAYSMLKSKLGLIQSEGNASDQYGITNKKYLVLGIYNAREGYAHFLSGKLSSLNFVIETSNVLTKESILEYFMELLGTPEPGKKSNTLAWHGKNLHYGYHMLNNNVVISLFSKHFK